MTAIILSIAASIIGLLILIGVLTKVRNAFRPFIVPEGHIGLLYRHGAYRHRLSPGRHRFWRRGHEVRLVDMRKTLLNVSGQEVLTADHVTLKFSVVLTYEIVQAEKAIHEVQGYEAFLHVAVQLALRAVVGVQPVETLLAQRFDVAAQLTPRVKADAEKIGIIVHAVDVKDVMFPTELKRAFGDVLKAKQEGQAALERARGESAALRNLANAARVLEGNPALMNLRVLQSLAAAQNGGNTLVLGMPAGFVPLKNGKAGSAHSDANAGEA